MKKQFAAFLFFFVSSRLAGQYDQYAGQSLGWIKIYNYKGAARAVTVEEETYSIAQLSFIDSVANWMQASYTPKGSLGDIIKYATPKKNLYHERYNLAVPPSVGARAMTYIYLKKVNGKWVPENNLGFGWSIGANEIPMNYRLMDFNTDKVCLFTIPGYDQRVIREQPQSDEAVWERTYNLSGHPVLGKYILYNVPRDGNTHRTNMVVLSKNNRPPFIPVSIGEALQLVEAALPVKYGEEKKSNDEKFAPGSRDALFFGKQLTDKYDKIRTTISQLRQLYRSRLGEPAYTTYGRYTLSDLANDYDIFTGVKLGEKGSFNTSFPILKVDPELQALCKTDKPQWILIKWYGADLEHPVFRHMHEAILAHFDFDYLYQFWFEPEKLKGRRYRAL